MKKITLIVLLITPFFIGNAQSKLKEDINLTIDNWHQAAAEANYNRYFEALAEDAIFIGTDANECWDKAAFKQFAKPYFDKGKAWNFKSILRHTYISEDQKIAWFDELLDTQMKICRGSGVLELINGQWKIKHYVLSMTIPNDITNEVVAIKTVIEESLINKLQSTKK